MTDSAGKVVQGSPDWLPAGWMEQVKVLRSGREIRCYTNLGTMQKFFSKEDVLEYITNGSTCMGNSKLKNGLVKWPARDDPNPNVQNTNERPEWLPEGWIMELKFRLSGRSIGQKYMIYVDPFTGRRFYSKPEVFRYLKSIKSSSCTTEQDMDSGMQSLWNRNTNTQSGCKAQYEPETPQDLDIHRSNSRAANQGTKSNTPISACNVATDEHAVEDLPLGWIKEVKARKSSKAVKSDPFYIDPVSGYVFRSKKDVFRYLETGDISSCVMKPKKRCLADLVPSNEKPSLSAAAKKHQSIEPAMRRHLFSDNEISDMSSPLVVQGGEKKRRQSERRSSQSSLSLASKGEPVQKEPSQDTVTVSSVKSEEDLDRTNLVLPTMKTSEGNQSHKKVGRKKSVAAPEVNVLPQETSPGTVRGRGGDKTRIKTSKSKRKERLSLPRRSSKRLAGLEPEVLADASSGAQARGIPSRSSSKTQTAQIGSLVLDIPERSASNQLCARPGVEPSRSASDANAQLNGQLTFRSKMSHEHQATSQEQPWELENGHEDYGKQELQFASPIRDPCSGLCQNFTFKMVGDEISKKETANEWSVAKMPDILQEQLVDKEVQKSRERKQSGNSCITKKKEPKKSINSRMAKTKEPDLPSRSPKGVSRSKPEEVYRPSGEPAVQMAARNSSKCDANLGASSPQFYMANGVSWKFKAFPETGIANQTSVDVNLSSLDINGLSREQRLYKNAEPLQTPSVASLQLQKPQPMELPHDKPESRNASLLGTSWSDPCLDFAIKTLTGVIPVPDAAGLGLTSPPATSNLNEVPDESRDSRYYIDSCSSNNRIALPCQAPGQHARVDHEKANSVSTDKAFHIANSRNQPILGMDMGQGQGGVLAGTSLQLEPGPSKKFSRQASGYNDVRCCEELSNGNDKPLGRYNIPGGQQLKENEKTNLERLDSQFYLPFADPWYDPCLEFAFKTLTGTMPVDDNRELQGYFGQQQLDTTQPQRHNGSLPDFGLPGIAQSNVSMHSDTADRNVSRQHFPVEPSFNAKMNF